MKCFPAHWDEDESLIAGLTCTTGIPRAYHWHTTGIMGMVWGSSLQEVMKEEFGKFGVLTGVAVASWVLPCFTWNERAIWESRKFTCVILCLSTQECIPYDTQNTSEYIVLSLEVRKDGQGRRCAFVNFERHEDAKECVNKCLSRSWSFSQKKHLESLS